MDKQNKKTITCDNCKTTNKEIGNFGFMGTKKRGMSIIERKKYGNIWKCNACNELKFILNGSI